MATIGCKNLHMVEMTDLVAETYDTTVKAFTGVKNIDITPNTFESKNVYDDGVGEIVTGLTSVEVAINTADLTPEDVVYLFGATKGSDGVVSSSSNDAPNTFAIMFESLLSDQANSRYTCIYKGKFQLPKESFTTKEDGGVTFADKQIVGTFIPLRKNGKYKSQVDSTDTTATTAIENWYKAPHGETLPA